MKFVIQRVKHAEVTVDENTIGRIGKGYMVLIGVSNCDDEAIADKMLDKMIKLRIFEDENGKTNLSLADVGGELLLISPDKAEQLYEHIIDKCKSRVQVVERGEFGADMKVGLLNDGPFTIVLDSKDIM